MSNCNNKPSTIKSFRYESLFEEPIFLKNGDTLVRIDYEVGSSISLVRCYHSSIQTKCERFLR